MVWVAAVLVVISNSLAAGSSTNAVNGTPLVYAQAERENPFLSEKVEPGPRSEQGEDPFRSSRDDTTFKLTDCGPTSTLDKAELRKPEIAAKLCEGRFADLDNEWLFILYYVRGFNEFLEERGSFMDPTGACSRAVEPRASLGLIYGVIDRAISGDLSGLEDERLKAMLKPFEEDWKRAPFILWELNVWKREGRLDATSVASRGMCGDPAFRLFWRKAIEYSQRVPTVDT